MAVSSRIEYCTDRDLLDIYPHISEYDLKKRLYNFTGPVTNVYTAYNTGEVTLLFADGVECTSDVNLNTNNDFYYTDSEDKLEFYHTANNPNDMIMEIGDDWETVKQRFRRKSSRLIESHLDSRMAREILKDREGNYPEIIVHATALQTVILLLNAHDPTNEVTDSFRSELNEILDGLKAGSIVLPTSVSGDSSKGVIREVSVNSSSDLRPVEVLGNYSGSGYELLQILIDTGEGGIIGTSKMTVKGKSSTNLKTEVLIDSETITGDYQNLGLGSMKIRWGGDDVATAITTAADEYEIELWGTSVETTVSGIGSVSMTRR